MKTNTTPAFITELLTSRIDAKKSELEGLQIAAELSLSDALRINEDAPDMPKDLTKESIKPWSDYYNEHKEALRIASLHEEIEANEKSLDLQLMHCPKKFVVTDGGLTSPSGFNISDRVFVQTKIAIHMDEQPTTKNTPASNVDLYVANIEDMIKKHG